MIQILLAALVWIFAPIPWLMTVVHILIKNNWWRSSSSKALVCAVSVAVWAILAYLLKANLLFLFVHQFSNSISLFFGIILLVVASLIEVLTSKALGRRRILCSSELERSKDKLVTAGIYKYARHPRYVEHPLWFVGLGLVFGYASLLWFALYLFISFSITAYFEEQELITRYGREYLEYKKRTPAFFVRA